MRAADGKVDRGAAGPRGVYLALAERLHGLTRIVAGAMLAIMLIDVNVAVFYRYVFRSPIYWADELAVSLMVWVSFLGAALALAAGQHYGFTGLAGRLPTVPRRIVLVAVELGFAVLLAIYVWTGFQVLGPIATQRLSALGISVIWVYAALPVGCALMMVELLAQYLGKAPNRDEVGVVAEDFT